MKEQNVLSPYQQHDDEIDLKELFLALWKGKWIIILITFLFAIGGVAYALSKPNIYKAEVILAPANGAQSSGLSSQLGGLASLAGINIGSSGTDDKAMALAVLKSRKFVNAYIKKHNLLVPLMASKEWDQLTGELVINQEVYDISQKKWADDDKGESLEPSAWEAYKTFLGALSVDENKDNGLVTLSITHLSPIIAKQWVEGLVTELNQWMKRESLDETKKNIGYLEGQIDKTSISDMQTVFYQLIEEQTKSLMLAEVQDEFAFKVIDPAVVPEEKVGPKRALICVLAVLLGGMLGVGIVLVRFAFKEKT